MIKPMQKIYQLRTGDILICQPDGIPFIQHFGVVVREGRETYVYHIVPERDVCRDTAKEFLATRKLLQIRQTSVTRRHMLNRYREVANRKYDMIEFNCVHFAEYLTN